MNLTEGSYTEIVDLLFPFWSSVCVVKQEKTLEIYNIRMNNEDDFVLYYSGSTPEWRSLADILNGEFKCLTNIVKKTPDCVSSYVRMCEHVTELLLKSEPAQKKLNETSAEAIYNCLSVPLLQGWKYTSDHVFDVLASLPLDFEGLLAATKQPTTKIDMINIST